LLVSTTMPIHLVADESGYGNQGNFFKQFGDQRGTSPAEFRRRHHLRYGREPIAPISQRPRVPAEPPLVL
jgi:AraC-like DNA-binding protein